MSLERIRLLVVIACGSLSLTLTTTMKAWAAAGVALLTAISGPVSPSIEQFSEIPADTRFALPKNATVQFLHYAAWEEVTVHGGAVVVTESGFSVERGKVDRRALPCRRETVSQEADGLLNLTICEPGSVVLR